MTAGAPPALLEVRDLGVRFVSDAGIARALDRVSLTVREGETLGLVGESGCGKTSLALALLGLLPRATSHVVDGSSIRFRGEELVGAAPERMRRLRGAEIAIAFQEPATALNPVLTVGEQIAETLRLHRGIGHREASADARRLIGEVGIADAARRAVCYPHQLSGGMRQRIMLAIALSCDPALLIADEPTSALDVTVQAQILDLVGELQARRGMAVVLVTHDVGVVVEACDRVAVMYAGQIVETGTVDEVLGAPMHPYTRGLLAAADSRGRRGRMEPIPGAVPSATDWPEGCRFRPRCAHALGGCDAEQEVSALEEGRAVRCWRAVAGGAEALP